MKIAEAGKAMEKGVKGPMVSCDGATGFFSTVGRDITGRIHAEKELWENQD